MKHTRSTKRKITMLICTVFLIGCTVMPASAAGGLEGSVLWTGFLQLIADATLISTIACPLVAALLWVLFSIARQAASDEPTEKKWNKKMRDSIVFGIAGCLGSGVISLVSSYFVSG